MESQTADFIVIVNQDLMVSFVKMERVMKENDLEKGSYIWRIKMANFIVREPNKMRK